MEPTLTFNKEKPAMSKIAVFILGFILFLQGVSAQEVYVDNVIILLDASGSMNNNMKGAGITKLQSAKTAIKEVMKTIPQSTQVGLLVFSDKLNGWAYPLDPRDDGKLFSAIDKLSAGGNTPLGEYMKKAADRLLEVRKAQYGYGSYRLLVVTDGEATTPSLVDSYTPDIVSRGIVIDVIGVDMVGAHTLATKVHSYRRANDPEGLKKAMQEIFAEVGKSADGRPADDAFNELKGLSNAMATAIISGMLSTENQPIGEKPVQPVAQNPDRKDSAQQQAQPNNKAPASNERGNPFWILYVIIGVIVLVSIVKKIRG
jgi:hypothetical protein